MTITGANLRLPLNPPFCFESSVNYDTPTGAGSAATGFAGLVAGTTPSGNVRAYDPELRPQFAQQWNAFADAADGAAILNVPPGSYVLRARKRGLEGLTWAVENAEALSFGGGKPQRIFYHLRRKRAASRKEIFLSPIEVSGYSAKRAASRRGRL